MFGILVFAVCTAGLVYVLVRRPRHPFPLGPMTDHWGQADGHRDHPGRLWLRRTLVELDTTPAQERAIVEAIDEAHSQLHELAGPVNAARKRVAAALRNDELSEQQLVQALDDPDQALVQARTVIGTTLAKIHAVLDPRQRRVLAGRLERHHAMV